MNCIILFGRRERDKVRLETSRNLSTSPIFIFFQSVIPYSYLQLSELKITIIISTTFSIYSTGYQSEVYQYYYNFVVVREIVLWLWSAVPYANFFEILKMKWPSTSLALRSYHWLYKHNWDNICNSMDIIWPTWPFFQRKHLRLYRFEALSLHLIATWNLRP